MTRYSLLLLLLVGCGKDLPQRNLEKSSQEIREMTKELNALNAQMEKELHDRAHPTPMPKPFPDCKDVPWSKGDSVPLEDCMYYGVNTTPWAVGDKIEIPPATHHPSLPQPKPNKKHKKPKTVPDSWLHNPVTDKAK